MTPLLLDAAAVYRLTRLATADTLTQPLRERVIERAYQRDDLRRVKPLWDGSEGWQTTVDEDRVNGNVVPWAADLVTCRWCASVWLALLAVAARRLAPRLWDPLARALAFSAAAALLAGLED